MIKAITDWLKRGEPRCGVCDRPQGVLPIGPDGLCQVCRVELEYKIDNATRIITDSIPIIEEGKNRETRLSRCDLVQSHAEGLLPYERLGIPTLRSQPSEIISRIEWARSKLQAYDGSFDDRRERVGRDLNPASLVEPIKEAKRAGELDTAEELCLKAINWTETSSEESGLGVTPWYYEQLAIVYRKQKRFRDEVSILQRFSQQKHARGAKPAQLLDRLARAKQLADENVDADLSRGVGKR